MPRTGPRSTPRSQMVGALPTFIALVLGSACLVAGGMGGLAVSEGCACPGRIWCRCRSECVRSQACIIRPAGLICKAMGWTDWTDLLGTFRHHAYSSNVPKGFVRSVQFHVPPCENRFGIGALDRPPAALAALGLESAPRND